MAPRSDPDLRAGERELLLGWLAFHYEDPEADFEGVAGADAAAAFEVWKAERARADELVAGVDRLDAPGGNGLPLRSNLLKVIGEYARHNGHADLLRECIDGAVGE